MSNRKHTDKRKSFGWSSFMGFLGIALANISSFFTIYLLLSNGETQLPIHDIYKYYCRGMRCMRGKF
jgi:hypothetical protein